MGNLNVQTILALALALPTALALPQFWPHGYNEKPYPTLTGSSSQGVYPTGTAGTTGTATGTGTGYFSTVTGTAYFMKKRSPGAEFDPDHPYGYPPPYKPSLSSSILPTGTGFPIVPTGSAPPMMSTYYPTATGIASGSGVGIPYATLAADKRAVEHAAQAHRQHFEGPRKRDVRPYYPYVPVQRYDGAGAPGTGTGTAVLPTDTGSGVLPTGTGVVPLPVPTGYSSSVIIDPMPSGTGGGAYPTGTGAGGVYPTGA